MRNKSLVLGVVLLMAVGPAAFAKSPKGNGVGAGGAPSGQPFQSLVFGPKQYTRMTGPPQTFTNTFEHCGTAPCQIVVVNGDAAGNNRISSATIGLNGKQVVSPSDFNQKVSQIVRPVTLADQNQLTVRLASKPGSFLTVSAQCLASPVVLAASSPGVSLQPNSLLSAVTLVNNGTDAADNVQVTAITLPGGTLTSPALPSGLGSIPAGGSTVLNADFSGTFTPGQSYALTVEGTYAAGGYTYCFTVSSDLVIPPAAPGSSNLGSIDVPHLVTQGGYAGVLMPDFDEEVNPPHWTVPTAPFVMGTPTPGTTMVMPAPFGDPPAIVFDANNPLDLISGGFNGQASTVAEPSGGATADGIIFATANWTAAYSTDGGSTFHQLNPTTIFPSDAVGYCCDQIVQYVPSIDRFVWFLQGNGYRLAMASPAAIQTYGGNAWTYWNLTPDIFGACTSFDYPDLAVGNKYLYMSWDAGKNCNGGFQVARTSLAGIQAGGTITIEFTHPSDAPMAWGSHLTQDTGDEVFWAGHNNNSNMRVFSLKEGDGFYSWRDVGISSWANNAPTSLTPDGQDWLAKNFNGPGGNSFPRNGVIGATRSGNELWFAWTAGTDDHFHQAHVEMVQLDLSNSFHKDQQVQIWNNDYAFAYPALATNVCTGEVGLSFEYGGNSTYYENHVVGFWGDYLAYITTGSDVGTNRFGDYVSIRQAPPTGTDPGNLFAAFGYGLNKVPAPGTGTNTDVHYVLFGRPASFCNIIG
jgi:hypothetical protein